MMSASSPFRVTVNDFNPVPVGVTAKFMPLGDSITEGYEGGYRIPLFRAARADNKSITFVGERANGPATVDGVPFPRSHEGYSGYYIDSTHSQYNISDLVEASLATHQPHLIALLIGANDVGRSGFADSGERLAILVDKILAAAPSALLLLGQNTPTQSDADNVNVRAYNAQMPAIVGTRAASGKHIMLVDMYGAFTADPNYKTNLLYDTLHPNPAGDVVLASTWYNAIGPLLRSAS